MSKTLPYIHISPGLMKSTLKSKSSLFFSQMNIRDHTAGDNDVAIFPNYISINTNWGTWWYKNFVKRTKRFNYQVFSRLSLYFLSHETQEHKISCKLPLSPVVACPSPIPGYTFCIIPGPASLGRPLRFILAHISQTSLLLHHVPRKP